MALELINIGAQDNDGTGDSLRVASAKTNRMFQEVYLSLNDPKVAAVGQDLLLGSASKIAIFNANLPALTTVANNMPAILNASMFATRAEVAAATAQAFVSGLTYSSVAAGAAANLDGKVFAVVGTDANTYATLYQVQTTTYDMRNGAMPAGTAIKRAAGANSRNKRVEYTDFDFTSGALAPGVTVLRAAGSWSSTSPAGGLILGTAANTPRFYYDPPVENRIPSSNVVQTKAYLAGTTSSDSGGVTTVNAGATGSTQFNAEYYGIAAATTGDARTFSVDLRGDVGGEIVYLIAQGSGGSEIRAYVRCVLTTAWQRFELSVTAGMTVQFFEIGANNRGTAPTEAIPAQVYYIRRRQLNSGPFALAYTETTGTAIYTPSVCRGLMFEPARTNYFLNSDTLTGRGTAGTVTFSTGRTSPTGAAAARIAFGDSSFVAPFASTAITAGQAWTTSLYAIADAATTINIGTNGNTATANNKGVTSNVDVAWSRLAYTNTPASADSGLYMLFGTSSIGAGTSGSLTARTVEASGIQMELGATVSSYIPTTTAIATRPAESIRIAVPTLADGNYVCTLFYLPGSYGATNSDVSLGRVVSGVMTIGIPDAQRSGVLQTVRVPSLPSAVIEYGAAVDTARFDYDPATGASRGVMIEPATTNLFVQSAINNTGWTRENANLVPDALVGLPGTPNLTRMEVSVAIAGGIASRVYAQAGDTDTTKTYTRSFYCKLGTPAYKYLWITRDGSGQVCFNMETGVVVSTTANTTVTVVALPNGVFRLILVSAGINAGGNNTFLWLNDRTNAPTVSGSTPAGTFCYVGGAMSELRTGATSYVPTAGATATRALETLTVQNVAGTYRLTYSDNSTQDLPLTPVGGVVSINATVRDKYNVLTVAAMIPVQLASIAGKSVTDELTRSIQRIGVYPEQYGAVGDGIADDTAALDAAAATGVNIVILPGKTYKIDRANGAIQLRPGQSVIGHQPGRSGGSQRTYLFNNAVGGGIFWYTGDSTTADVKMPRISNLSMSADYPIRFNDERTAVLKDGAASNCPPGKKPSVTNCDINARVANQGIGISWSKMFDGDITGCDIVGFDINVLLNGCDLNRVEHNRMQIAGRRHVLELGAGSFGSQNVIRHNDLLEVGPNGIHVQSSGRHRRITDNYNEQGGQCLGFYDCSNLDVISYAGNVASEQFTTVVRDNRIDGKANATQFVYRYQAEGQTYGEIIDVGTSGLPPSARPLALVNSAGAVLNAVPFTFNQTNKSAFVFQGPDFGIWNGYRTVETPSLRITGRNVAQFSAPAIFADKSWLYLRGRDESLVLLPRPSGSNDDPVFNFIFDAATRLFAAGFTCVAEVIARAPGAGETLSIGSKVDGAGGALTGASLNSDFRKILVQFTSGSSNGCYLKRTQNGGEIEIRSLRVYPLYAQEIPFTSATTVTMGLDQIEGQIEVYGEGAGGGAPAAYLYGFANNRLIKLGESVTNPDALAVTTTQSSDLSTLTFTLSGGGGGKQFTVRRKTLA